MSGSEGEVWIAGAQAPRIEARALTVSYRLHRGPLRRGPARLPALVDLWLHVEPAECLALVGESGSGKTTAARALLRLVEPEAGEVWWRTRAGEREDLLAVGARRLRALRPELGIVFQDPLASLDPRQRVGHALGEPLAVHLGLPAVELERRVAGLLERVGLGGEVAPRFPHELSGGQRQRVAIARALALEPRLLVCDEIASALDVSVTAQVLERLEDLARELELALLYVSHDLATVRHVADRVMVLYLGRPVELGPAAEVLQAPAHPYTRLLVDSAPRLDASAPPPSAPRGEPPSPLAPPPGCAFHPRCPLAEPRCAHERPRPRRVGPGRVAACHALDGDPSPAG